jgi:hypothetical protein
MENLELLRARRRGEVESAGREREELADWRGEN